MPPECYCPCLLLNWKSKTPFSTSCYSPLVCCLEHCPQVAAQEVQKIYGHRYSDEVVYPTYGSSHMIFSEPTFSLVKSQPHATTCSQSPHMLMALVPHHIDTPVKKDQLWDGQLQFHNSIYLSSIHLSINSTMYAQVHPSIHLSSIPLIYLTNSVNGNT
jgi:hypothetical protein